MAFGILSRVLAATFALTTLTAQAPSPTAVPLVAATSCARPNVPAQTVHIEPPVFPPSIDGKRPTGEVEVIVSLDEANNIVSAHARNGPEALRTVAEETARKSKFTTEIIACKPVAKSFIFVVRYDDTAPCENRDIPARTARAYPPETPKYARDHGITGIVHVAIDLDESGQIVKAEATDGPEILRQAALSSVRKSVFAPHTVNCVGQASRYEYVVSFEAR